MSWRLCGYGAIYGIIDIIASAANFNFINFHEVFSKDPIILLPVSLFFFCLKRTITNGHQWYLTTTFDGVKEAPEKAVIYIFESKMHISIGNYHIILNMLLDFTLLEKLNLYWKLIFHWNENIFVWIFAFLVFAWPLIVDGRLLLSLSHFALSARCFFPRQFQIFVFF